VRPLRVVFAVAISACGLFPDLGTLTGDDAAASDASADAPFGTFCGTVDAFFCEDFDEPDGAYADRWTSTSLGDGNTLMTQSTEVTSAPNALVVEVPSGGSGGAALWTDLPENATAYDYTFSIRFEPYDAGAGSVLWAQIEVDGEDAGNEYTEYRFSTYAGGTNFEAHVFYPDGGNTVGSAPLPVTFAPGQWYRVEEKLTVLPPPTKIQILVNNVQVLSTTITQATNGTGSAEFMAGIYHTNGATGPWRIEIDDVVMRVQ
jgi:hypothetical protein